MAYNGGRPKIGEQRVSLVVDRSLGLQKRRFGDDEHGMRGKMGSGSSEWLFHQQLGWLVFAMIASGPRC